MKHEEKLSNSNRRKNLIMIELIMTALLIIMLTGGICFLGGFLSGKALTTIHYDELIERYMNEPFNN